LGSNEGKDKTRNGNEKAIDDKEEKTNTSSSETQGIAKAVNDSKAAQRQLEEMQRHNRAMEDRGLYLAPYKRGQGFSTV